MLVTASKSSVCRKPYGDTSATAPSRRRRRSLTSSLACRSGAGRAGLVGRGRLEQALRPLDEDFLTLLGWDWKRRVSTWPRQPPTIGLLDWQFVHRLGRTEPRESNVARRQRPVLAGTTL